MNKILRNLMTMCCLAAFTAFSAFASGTYTVELTDLFGDGWNGGYLTVNVNGSAVSPAGGWTIVDGASETYTFNAVDGDLIEAYYSDCAYDSENIWKIIDCQGVDAILGKGSDFDDNTCGNGEVFVGDYQRAVVAIAPGDCEVDFVISMTDAFGDGWQGASVEVEVLDAAGAVVSTLSASMPSGGFPGNTGPTLVPFNVIIPAGGTVNISSGGTDTWAGEPGYTVTGTATSYGADGVPGGGDDGVTPISIEVTAGTYNTTANMLQFSFLCPDCIIICPVAGSGTWTDQYFLQAGECCVQATIPLEVSGTCEIIAETTVTDVSTAPVSDGLVFATNGADPGVCPDTNAAIDTGAGTLFLEESDPVAFGGGGANTCTQFAAIYNYGPVPGDGDICFDWATNDLASAQGGIFGWAPVQWGPTVAGAANLAANVVELATYVNPAGPVAGSTCVTLAKGDFFSWVVYTDFATLGNVGLGALQATISNVDFTATCTEVVCETLPQGTVNFQVELCEGEDQIVPITYEFKDGTVFTCDVEVDVFPYTGPISDALACNDNVNISLDEDCGVTFGADMFLEGGPYKCYDDYVVRIRPFGGNDYLVIDPATGSTDVNTLFVADLPLGQHIYEVICLETGNTCWGYFTIEDKFAPALACECPIGGDFFIPDPVTGTTAGAADQANWDTADACGVGGGDGVSAIAGNTDYVEFTFTTNCTQFVEIAATTAWGDGQLYVYDQPLDPTNICDGLVGWDGDSGPGFDPLTNVLLDAGTYYLYISSWAPGQSGDFTITASGECCGLIIDGAGFAQEVSPKCEFSCTDEFNWEVIDELPVPEVIDNCGTGDLSNTDIWLDGAECGQRILLRNWLLTDPNTGETTTCTQEFHFNGITAGDLLLPPSPIAIPCGEDASPADIAASLGLESAYPHYIVGDKTFDDNGNFIGYTDRAVAVTETEGVCNLFVSFTDVVIPTCAGCPGNSKIIRSWEILDWCDSSVTPYTQIIDAADYDAPEISAPDVTVSVEPWTCTADFYLPCPEHLHDDCYGENLGYEVFGPAGVTVTQVPSTLCSTGYQYVASGAPKTMVGNPHIFKYVATDCCGNVGEYEMAVTVLDNTPPVAIAKENIVISLTSTPGSTEGVAKMYPNSVDNGSHDGDCGPIHLEIRRTDGSPACGNLGALVSDEDESGDCADNEVELQDGSVFLCYYNNNLTFNNDATPLVPSDAAQDDDNRFDTDNGEFVKFCCEDLTDVDGNGTAFGLVEVLIRVWDDGNMSGAYGDWVDNNADGDFQDPGELDNYSDTWAYVRVEDKLAPQIYCPPHITLKCDQDYTDTTITGVASASSTCAGIGVSYTDDTDISTCGAGIVKRTWCVDGTSKCCDQYITVDYYSTWDPCDRDAGIIWPRDWTGEPAVQDPWCGRNDVPRDPITCEEEDTGEPEWTDSPCDLIGYNLESDTFHFEDGACYKVLNHWSVINWCIYNPNDADWNNISNQGLDADNDGIPNIRDLDDNGNGIPDSHYEHNNPLVYPPNIWFAFDSEGGLYGVDAANTLNPVIRDYSIDIWDLTLVDSDDGYFGEFDPELEDDGIADGLYTHTQVIKFLDEESPEILVEENCYPVDENCELIPPVQATACDTLSDCNSEWIKWQAEVDIWGDWTVDYVYSSFIADIPANRPFYVEPTQSCEMVSLQLPAPIEGSKYQHRVLWRATDGCGNITSHTSFFTVEDKKPPTPYCINLSTALMENGEVELWACDFNAGAFDNCAPQDWLSYTFNGPEDGFFAPEDVPNWIAADRCQGKTFDCSHFEVAQANGGYYPVRIYVWDECNNVDFCMVNLRLVDNQGACGGTPGASRMIAGEVFTEAGEEVIDVMIESNEMSSSLYNMDMTDQAGQYSIVNPISMDYEISATKNDDYINGVTTLDIVLIQQHILDIKPLDSAYKLIAADASNDERVSGIDLVQIRKLILGVADDFPNNDSWRFVDAKQTLDYDNPWPFTELLEVSSLSDDMMDEDFVGVKIGDVNGSVVTTLTGGQVEARNAQTLELNAIPTLTGNGEVSIEVTSKNFNDVYGMQFTLEAAGLELTGVYAGALDVTAENFAVVNGKVTSSWSSEAGVTTSEPLFTLTFNGTSVENGVAINSSITTAEAYVGAELQTIDVALEGAANNAFALLQNEPNPFNNVSIVGFNLPAKGQATLTVYDVTGKVLKTVRGEYEQGYNEIELSKKDINTSGVLYYQLDSGDYTATKKMIILD